MVVSRVLDIHDEKIAKPDRNYFFLRKFFGLMNFLRKEGKRG